MEIFICDICNSGFHTKYELTKHFIIKHKYKSEDAYIKCTLNGVLPTCECGCGGKPKFISSKVGYYRFLSAHHNRVKGKNNFHKDPKTHQKAIETQKKNWQEGKYTGWWEKKDDETLKKIEGIKEKLRNNKERGEKISKALRGRPKTGESKIKLSNTQKKRYDENPELRVIASKNKLEWMKKNSKVKTSKLEIIFEKFLNELGLIRDIDYIHNHLVFKIKTFFDFYLPKNNIIIEVDGDFYHCNPNSVYSEPKYEIQCKNISNDKRKDTWCKNHNIKLIRYWEKDINERPEWVITDLRKQLKIV